MTGTAAAALPADCKQAHPLLHFALQMVQKDLQTQMQSGQLSQQQVGWLLSEWSHCWLAALAAQCAGPAPVMCPLAKPVCPPVHTWDRLFRLPAFHGRPAAGRGPAGTEGGRDPGCAVEGEAAY